MPLPDSRTIIVIPCFNEAGRLELAQFERCLELEPNVDFLFVNDGSLDTTLEVLRDFEKRFVERVFVLDQQPNRGKAEAVRRGVLEAFEREPALIGYWDADLAAPLEELPRFVEIFAEHPECVLVTGARVKLLGRSIERNVWRHYLGRVAATIASSLLRLAVYDTQCGAKMLRATPEMRVLFDQPFLSSWIFDVELLARLIQQRRRAALSSAEDVIYELPLMRWHDVAGSNIRGRDYLRALGEIVRVHLRYLRD